MSKNIVILGFPKCGTTALMRAFDKHEDVSVLRSKKNNSYEVAWPEIKKVEQGQASTPAGSITAHKYTAYIFSKSALQYLSKTDRTFVLCIRDPLKALISWHNMHRELAVSGRIPEHFVMKEQAFYAKCDLNEYFSHYAQQRLQYDNSFTQLLSYVPSKKIIVVSQERMAMDIESVAQFVKAFANGASNMPLQEARKEAAHASFAEGAAPDVAPEIVVELGKVNRRLRDAIDHAGVCFVS